MVVEKQKLDTKVKEMKDSILVDLALQRCCLVVIDALNSPKTPLSQMADQSIKNLEDQQDEYDFKINTLKNRGESKHTASDRKTPDIS